jgi:hypothetical protein
MDFIEALPKVHGKSVILTVVDRFSKAAHFIPLGHPYTSTSVAHAFFAEIVRLHGIPASIVSDRDSVFTCAFWQELFALAGVKLKMSSAFHPQSDGQSEATNKIIAMYLRCLTGDRPRQWLEWLPWAEFCYNSSYQQAIKTSPFELVYGRPPPSVRSYAPGEAKLPAVEKALKDRDDFLAEVKDRLEQAQHHYKAVYDRSHRPVEFEPGQWVWLRLLHRPVASLQVKGRGKLGPKFFGPYQVLQRVGKVAYKLALPAGARIHDVFHVGLLKPFYGEQPLQPPALPPLQNGRVLCNLRRCSKAGWLGGVVRSWFAGRGCHRLSRPGWISMILFSSTLTFSSRTSCFPREGEMLCMASHLADARETGELVAKQSS